MNVSWYEFLKSGSPEGDLYHLVRDFISWRGKTLCEAPVAEQKPDGKCRLLAPLLLEHRFPALHRKPKTQVKRDWGGYMESARLRLHKHSKQYVHWCNDKWESSREKFYFLKPSEALEGCSQPWKSETFCFGGSWSTWKNGQWLVAVVQVQHTDYFYFLIYLINYGITVLPIFLPFIPLSTLIVTPTIIPPLYLLKWHREKKRKTQFKGIQELVHWKDKIDKPLTRPNKKKWERTHTHTHTTRGKRGGTTTDNTEIQWTVINYYAKELEIWVKWINL